MDYQIIPEKANTLLLTSASHPFLVQNNNKTISVLNTHTFSQQDFDAVGEVLLSPRQLGLLELPRLWVNTIRATFLSQNEPILDAPSRVSMQQLSDQSFVIHNYNQENTVINVQLPLAGNYIDGFSGKPIITEGKELKLTMAPRSRIWVKSLHSQ